MKCRRTRCTRSGLFVAVTLTVLLAATVIAPVVPRVAAAAPKSVAFASGPGWVAYSNYPGTNVSGASQARYGPAQAVCLNTWSMLCPPGAVDFMSPYSAWTSALESIPGAQWVWRPGAGPMSSNADLDRVVFSRTIVVAGKPSGGWISLAADDYAEVRVNGVFVGAIGSVSLAGPSPAYGALTTFDITSFVKPGANTIDVLAQNGPAETWGYCGAPCTFAANPAGVVFGGAVTVEIPTSPPPGGIRIRPFACAANGGQAVPAGVLLYLQGGYLSGTHGLVTAGVRADATTITETRAGTPSTRSAVFGSVYSAEPGLWRADGKPLDVAPLAPGESTSVTVRYATHHTVTDLLLPWSELGVDYDGNGLQYFDHYGDEVIEVTCVVTGT